MVPWAQSKRHLDRFSYFCTAHGRYLLPTSNRFRTLLPVLVVKVPKSCHITPILRSLHWLKITECIEYKLLLLTYKVLTTTQPPYLHKYLVTLARPTDRSFRCASPCVWNQLPSSLRQPHPSLSVSYSPVPAPTTSSHSVNSPLSPSITPCLFHCRFKTYLFHKSFPPYSFFRPQD